MQGVGEQVLEALVLEIVDVAHGRVEYPLAIGVLADPGPGCRLLRLSSRIISTTLSSLNGALGEPLLPELTAGLS